MGWFNGLSTLWKIAVGIAAAIALLFAANFVIDLFTGSNKTKAKLGENQQEAAVESGKDAVNTVGNRASEEDAIDDKVEGVKDAVENAEGTTAIDDAGRRELCESFDICAEE